MYIEHNGSQWTSWVTWETVKDMWLQSGVKDKIRNLRNSNCEPVIAEVSVLSPLPKLCNRIVFIKSRDIKPILRNILHTQIIISRHET